MEPNPGLTARQALAIYAAGFFSLSFSVLMGLAVPLWTVVLHATPAATGIVLGVRSMLPLLLAIHVGALMDRTDTRRPLIGLAALGAFLPILYPLFPWMPALLVLQMVT